MNDPNSYAELRFQRLRIPRKVMVVVITVVLYYAAWRFINPNTFFWLGLIVSVLLAWIASYGWRQALVVLVHFLQRLETY